MKTRVVKQYELEDEERAVIVVTDEGAVMVTNQSPNETWRAVAHLAARSEVDLREFIRGGYEPMRLAIKCSVKGCLAAVPSPSGWRTEPLEGWEFCDGEWLCRDHV